MTRVLLLGGKGYFGRQVAQALRAVDIDVQVASRTGDIRIDLADASTYTAFDGFPTVVNCTDTVAVDPTPAVAHVLAQGSTFVETTDDANVLLKLIQTFRGVTSRGRLAAGLGLMPGLSNLAAADLMKQRGGAETLEVAIRFNPLSGAGAGMSGLSARVIANVGKRWVNGELVTTPPVWAAPMIPFRSGLGTAVRTGLPEAMMLGFSTGAKTTAAYLSTGSPLIETGLFGLALGFPQDPLFKPAATEALSRVISAVRGGPLRDVRTPFEIVAMADRRDAFRHDGDWLRVTVSDGIAAAGVLVADGVKRLMAQPVTPGVFLPDEWLTLDQAVSALQNARGVKVSVTRYTAPSKRSVAAHSAS
jgi:hypothetical protein